MARGSLQDASGQTSRSGRNAIVADAFFLLAFQFHDGDPAFHSICGEVNSAVKPPMAMSGIFESLTAYVSQHSTMAELIVFIVAMAEAVAVIGALVPGSTVLITVGALVGLGHLPLWPILGSAVLGAVAGDGLSYWLGYRLRDRIPRAWPFVRRPELLLQGVEFFRKYGAMSIVAGRFVPVMRAIVPVMAGTFGMRPARFYAVNVLSALIWAPAHILPGAIFGSSLDSLGLTHDGFALLLTAAIILLAILPLILRLAIRQTKRWLS